MRSRSVFHASPKIMGAISSTTNQMSCIWKSVGRGWMPMMSVRICAMISKPRTDSVAVTVGSLTSSTGRRSRDICS